MRRLTSPLSGWGVLASDSQLWVNSQPPLVPTSQSVPYLEKHLRAEYAKKNSGVVFGTPGCQSVHLRLPGAEASARPAPAGPDRSNEAYLLRVFGSLSLSFTQASLPRYIVFQAL